MCRLLATESCTHPACCIHARFFLFYHMLHYTFHHISIPIEKPSTCWSKNLCVLYRISKSFNFRSDLYYALVTLIFYLYHTFPLHFQCLYFRFRFTQRSTVLCFTLTFLIVVLIIDVFFTSYCFNITSSTSYYHVKINVCPILICLTCSKLNLYAKPSIHDMKQSWKILDQSKFPIL